MRRGGVSPIGHPRPLRTILDADLAQQDLAWAGGADPHTRCCAAYAELLELTSAATVPVKIY
ncbi:YbaK/EbsC family protein [Rhodococcus koreensis]|uniref:YbaK/EbsC family protein n=1 Tax=Rhodococcus koreensis TaxID=99653 RepID=UPI0009337B69|nr:hypothetical protein JWS14_04160 [Rhodococcus koreensis]